jgi:hypothetical protein
MTRGRTPQPVPEAEIIANFQAGMSLADVRAKYHIGDARARGFRALAAQSESSPVAGTEQPAAAADEAAEEPLFPGNPDCFHLDTYIPCDRINFALSNLTREDAIASLLNLSPENKALALEFLIQRLVKAMVAEVDAEVAQTQEISSAADFLRDYRNAQSTTA